MLASKDINDLISIVAALRNPESGYAWNIKQTFESIIPYMLEEAYEVIDAIERGNRTDLCEELGDLLLQVVYHAMIATEERSFTFEDVVYAITAKMIRRHPHVFGNTEQKSRGFVEEMWEHIKKIEKAEPTKQYEKISVPDNELVSYLIQVKSAQPADQEALALQKAAAEVGFKSYDSDKTFAKIKEKLNTLKEAIKIEKNPI